MTELKSCPFCGHPTSRLLFKREYCKDAEGFVAVRYRIWRICNKCRARGGYVLTSPQIWDKDPRCDWADAYRAEANGKWNRRVGDTDADE